MPDARKKVMPRASGRIMPDTSGKGALIIGDRVILVANSGAVPIRDELLAAGNKAELGLKEDRGLAVLERPVIIVRITIPIN